MIYDVNSDLFLRFVRNKTNRAHLKYVTLNSFEINSINRKQEKQMKKETGKATGDKMEDE